MNMNHFKITKTPIEGLLIIEPRIFRDERGYFMETYNYRELKAVGLEASFVQENQSMSKKGVLRGLHFQKKYPQGKLVRVLSGEVFDVAVDLRPGIPTYRRWFGLILSAKNKKQLYIPPGFAHGFLVLSEEAVFAYKCTDYYHPEDESGIIYNDPQIGIEWPPIGEYIVSAKDRKWNRLE